MNETTAHRPVVAAFDVDGTLTRRDCVRPFLLRVGGAGAIVRAVVAAPAATLRAVLRRDRDLVKDVVVGGVLHGRDVAAVDEVAEEFAAHVAASWLRDDVVERLRWHRSEGHAVVLVSASLGCYLRPLGRHLGVDAVLCAEVLEDGARYGRGLDGANCRRAEKVRRLDAWLAATMRQDAVVWAYGDSAGDTELLARADRAHRIDRRRLPREGRVTG